MQNIRRPFRITFVVLTFFSSCISSVSLIAQDPPKTTFSTLYGGSGTDDCDAVSVDGNGNTYLGCHLSSPDLPGSEKYEYSLNGDMDAFVVKLGSEDNSVDYITHWGGGAWDAVQGLVADVGGNVFVVGATYSEDFPVSTSAAQPAFGGSSDVFVAKLDPAGGIVWTTFFGGNGDEDSSDIVVDERGNIHIAGRTSSTNLPTDNDSYQMESSGGSDAFIATFDTNGRLVYVSYLGGSGADVGAGLAVDSTGRRFISGFTDSADFPLLKALAANSSGNEDVFVTVLNAQGNKLDFSTTFGGSGVDRAVGLGISDSGHVLVAGDTSSSDLPTTLKDLSFSGGRSDVFIASVNITRPALEYLSYFGGSGADRLLNLELSDSGKLVLVGDTTSPDFPMSYDFRSGANEKGDGYIAIIDLQAMSALTAILSGGTNIDVFEDVAIGSDGSITVSGASNSTDFPAVAPIQTEFKGGRFDILVAKFHLGLPP